MNNYEILKSTILNDPSTFRGTKKIIQEFDAMDVVDALNILEVLTDLFNYKLDFINKRQGE